MIRGEKKLLNYFKGFIGYSEDEFIELWKKAIFVVDTNILINFYKYKSKQSSKSLLDILKKLKETDRLWIPHQVALEYFFNYEDNKNKQKEAYKYLEKELTKLNDEAKKTLEKVKNKHPYIITEKFKFIIENIEKSNKTAKIKIHEEIKNLPDSNSIQDDILELLEGVIGEPFTQKRIDKIEKDGVERYRYDIPPGYKDKTDDNKKTYRTYGEFRYQQLYGDLIVWNQIIDRVKHDKRSRPVIFITEDRKEDWWEKEGNSIKRPHPHLIQEFFNETKQNFYMYRTDSFVRFAIKYLRVTVSEEQAQEVTNEIENIRKNDNFKVQKSYIRNGKDIDEVLEYLTEEEIEIYNKIRHVKNGLSSGSGIEYTNWIKANKFAINIAIPRMEMEFKRLILKLNLINKEKGLVAEDIFNKLPERSNARVRRLIKEIKDLKDYIDFNSSFPDRYL